jgi:hypothetical protein
MATKNTILNKNFYQEIQPDEMERLSQEDDEDYFSKNRKYPLKIQPHFDNFVTSLKLYGFKKEDTFHVTEKRENGQLRKHYGPLKTEGINSILVRRINESTNLYGKEYDVFTASLDMQAKLLTAVAQLSECLETKPPAASSHSKKSNLALDAQINLVIAMKKSEAAIRVLTTKFITSPIKTVPLKDIQLLHDATISIIEFYKNPHDKKNMQNLVFNTQQVFRKMGSFWNSIKKALLNTVGVACILVGVLGLVPSFGASLTFMAIGAGLCGYAHLPGFTKKDHKQIKTADQLSREMNNIFITTKKLLSFKENKTVGVQHTKIHRPRK